MSGIVDFSSANGMTIDSYEKVHLLPRSQKNIQNHFKLTEFSAKLKTI